MLAVRHGDAAMKKWCQGAMASFSNTQASSSDSVKRITNEGTRASPRPRKRRKIVKEEY